VSVVLLLEVGGIEVVEQHDLAELEIVAVGPGLPQLDLGSEVWQHSNNLRQYHLHLQDCLGLTGYWAGRRMTGGDCCRGGGA
jgi:hypothetical protein